MKVASLHACEQGSAVAKRNERGCERHAGEERPHGARREVHDVRAPAGRVFLSRESAPDEDLAAVGEKAGDEVGRVGQDGRRDELLVSRVGPEPDENEAVLVVELHDEKASVRERLGPLNSLEDEAFVSAEGRDAENPARHVRDAVEEKARSVRGPFDTVHRAGVAPLGEDGPVAGAGIHDGDLREAPDDGEESDAAPVG